jgi:hypothetical protein
MSETLLVFTRVPIDVQSVFCRCAVAILHKITAKYPHGRAKNEIIKRNDSFYAGGYFCAFDFDIAYVQYRRLVWFITSRSLMLLRVSGARKRGPEICGSRVL